MKNLRIAGFITLLLTVPPSGVALAALHPGDTVKISVYNHPELSTQATVDAQGRIMMPLAGAVPATGANEDVVAARIRSRLAAYMRYPAVDVVLVSQNAQMFVVGGPGGTLVYRPGETLASAYDALQDACKCLLNQTAADTTRIRIIRDGSVEGTYNADALRTAGQTGPSLLPGDEIAFMNRPVAVNVTGAIKTPGTAYLNPGQTLADAVAQLGGLSANASFGQMILKRGGDLTQIGSDSPEFSQPARYGDSLAIPAQEHVQVMGAVNGSGEVTLKEDFTLLSALYMAGGPNHWADLRHVVVRRNGITKTYNLSNVEHGNLTENAALQDGDVVFVPEGHKIDWRQFFQVFTFGRYFIPYGRW